MEEKVPYYLWIDSVRGGGTVKGHEGWIPIWDFYLEDITHNSARGRGRTFETVRFESSEDKGIQVLFEKMSSGGRFKTAKLDQAYSPREPATLFTMEEIDVLRIRRNERGYEFKLRNRNFNSGAGHAIYSSGGPESRWVIS